MPRRYKKKPYKKRRKKYRAVMRSPIATKMITKMRYQTSTSLDAGNVGTADAHVFTCNGLFDPDITSSGHQPRGFDQLMALYDHYVVLGAKITVIFAQQTDAVDAGNIVGITLKDSSVTSPYTNDYLEDGYNKYSCTNARDGNGLVRLTYNVNPAKFLSRSKPLSDPQLKGSIAGNPDEQVFFHVFAGGMDAANGGLCNINVVIDYIVALIEPKNPTQS